MKVLDGWARKVALCAILASSVGWLIFVICFGGFNNADNFYNDIGENNRLRVFSFNNARVPLPFLTRERNGTIPIGDPVISQQDREEDFPKNRADSDAVTYYFFAAVFPVAVILTVLHLILHAVPVLGLIISLAAHLLLTLSLVCGSGAFWQDGTRLFSDDNNFRNTFTSAVVAEDWLTDEYWGSWLVGEWVGLLITGIFVIIYFGTTPFFTNTGQPFSRYNADVELNVKSPNV